MPEVNLEKTLYFPEEIDSAEFLSSPIAILCSGGVESAILSVALTKQFKRVFPLYVRFGLKWESVELSHLRNYLESVKNPRLAGLTILDQSVADVYPDHWSLNGISVPDASTADAAVYLPGRNLLLLTKAALWSALNGVSMIALGTLSTNPFPDATDSFFSNLEKALSEGLDHPLKLVSPFGKMHKEDVLQIGQNMPVHLSFSCIKPVHKETGHIHCGACNKCHERYTAFECAGLVDKTEYASSHPPTPRASKLCTK